MHIPAGPVPAGQVPRPLHHLPGRAGVSDGAERSQHGVSPTDSLVVDVDVLAVLKVRSPPQCFSHRFDPIVNIYLCHC